MDVANELQRVIDTLSSLNIVSTYNNMNKLLGCLQVLANIRDVVKERKADTLQEVKDGNADAE